MGLNLLYHAKMHEDWRDMYIAVLHKNYFKEYYYVTRLLFI